jgi:hypothetical protein
MRIARLQACATLRRTAASGKRRLPLAKNDVGVVETRWPGSLLEQHPYPLGIGRAG